MTPLELVLAILVLLFGSGAIWQYLSLRMTQKTGLKSDERAITEQVQELWSTFTDTLQVRLVVLEDKVKDLENQRVLDQEWINIQEDHISSLEQHIQLKKDPPPPTRPSRRNLIPN